MRWFPLFLDLGGLPVLLVGGGEIALRKLRLLNAAGARVTVLSPRFDAALADLAAADGATLRRACFTPDAVTGHRLVIAATDDPDVNREVAQAAAAAGLFCNVVDDGAASSAIVPAIVDRSPLLIAISSFASGEFLRLRKVSICESGEKKFVHRFLMTCRSLRLEIGLVRTADLRSFVPLEA